MYKISVETNFSAAHKLINYQGDCERTHGHNWTVKAQIATKNLDSIGLGYDFKKLKYHLNEIIKKFDHQFLNKIHPFNKLNPSSENLAKYVFDSLKEILPSNIQVISVEIKESEKCAVIYSED